ncbi:MAG: hypothetical protein WEC14_06600 [Chloroflexota bacterium]
MTRRELPMMGPSGSVDPRVADPDDPLELVGVPVPVDEATFDEMARCLVEEYVREGWGDARLMALFRSPFYAGLHVIWRRRGEAWVTDLIAETRRVWHRPARSVEGPR